MKLLNPLSLYFTSYLFIGKGLTEDGGIILINIGIVLNIISLNAFLKGRGRILPAIFKDFSTELIANISVVIGLITIFEFIASPSMTHIISTVVTIGTTVIYVLYRNKPRNQKATIDIKQLATDVQRVVDAKLEYLPHKIDEKYHHDINITKGKDVVFKYVHKGQYGEAMKHIKHMIEVTQVTLSEDVEEEYQYLAVKYI